MALSTETEALLGFYNQKIQLDTQQITQVGVIETGYEIQTGVGASDKIKVYGPQELIDNYNVPIIKLDNKILEYNNQIRDLQQQVLTVGQTANSVGCGTTGVARVVVYQDNLNYTGYGFSAPNPFQSFSGTITSTTVGLGTVNTVGVASIGTYYGNTGTCYRPAEGCGITFFNPIAEYNCSDFVNDINNLNSQITSLKALRDPLIEKVNTLKAGRADFQLQLYAYTQTKSKLNDQIQKTEAIVGFLQDPANAEWL